MEKTINELKANAILIKDWAMDFRTAALTDDYDDWTTTAYYAPAELVRQLGLTLDYDVRRDFDWITFFADGKIVHDDGKEYVLVAEVGGRYSDIERQRSTASCANYCKNDDGDIVEVVDYMDFDDCEHIDESLEEAIARYRAYCNDKYPPTPSDEDLNLLLINDIISQEEYNKAAN